MILTRRQTAYYELGFKIGNFQVISDKLPENDPVLDALFNEIDEEFQDVCDLVEGAEEDIYGTDEHNESYILIPIPDRKPPSRPPSFP